MITSFVPKYKITFSNLIRIRVLIKFVISTWYYQFTLTIYFYPYSLSLSFLCLLQISIIRVNLGKSWEQLESGLIFRNKLKCENGLIFRNGGSISYAILKCLYMMAFVVLYIFHVMRILPSWNPGPNYLVCIFTRLSLSPSRIINSDSRLFLN